MYEEVCYKKPFLKEAIIRVDFSAPINDIGKKVPAEIADNIADRFPISEPKTGFKEEAKFTTKEKSWSHTRSEFTIWLYHGIEREKRLTIAPDNVNIQYLSYSTYEVLRNDFITILQGIMNKYPDARGKRVGLRYVNVIELPLSDPFSWNEYINTGMLGLFSHFKERQNISRIFHIVDLRYEDVNVKCQFGMPNQDFPAPIKKPIFVLDFDGYVDGSQNIGELKTNIDRAHKNIRNYSAYPTLKP